MAVSNFMPSPSSAITVTIVSDFYESADLTILRNAHLKKRTLKLNKDFLVVQQNDQPYQTSTGAWETYLLTPGTQDELNGLTETIHKALLRESSRQQILFSYRMSKIKHWVTVQILIHNKKIIVKVHDSANYYNYKTDEIGSILKKSFDLEIEPRILPVIQQANVYCGGYSARLAISLMDNPEQDLTNVSVWQCGDNNDQVLRKEDAELVSQFGTESDKATFGSTTQGMEYEETQEHKKLDEQQKSNQDILLVEFSEIMEKLDKSMLERLSIKIQELEKANHSSHGNTAANILKNIRILYQFCHNDLDMIPANNPCRFFFKDPNKKINAENDHLNSEVVLKELWHNFIDLLPKRASPAKNHSNANPSTDPSANEGSEDTGDNNAEKPEKYLSFKHQDIINQKFQEYYKELNAQDPIDPLDFGFISYIQTVCCGTIFKKTALLEQCTSKPNAGCPKCGSSEIQDQLYCMSLRLQPSQELFKLDKKQLLLNVFRKVIKNKCYFLLEHLLCLNSLKTLINFTDDFGKTLLHYAIEAMDQIAAAILIRNGAEINAPVRFMLYPLEYLYDVDQHKDEHPKSNDSNYEKNFRELEKMLQEYGAITRIKRTDAVPRLGPPDNYQGTALHLACMHADEIVVHQVIKQSDINALNANNWTPLANLAVNISGNARGFSILKLFYTLLKKQPKDFDNDTCLHMCLELLLSLQKINALRHDDSVIEFSLSNELYHFYEHTTRHKKLHFGTHDALSFQTNNAIFWVCDPKNITWSTASDNLFKPNDFFKTDILDSINKSTEFSGQIILPCSLEQNLVLVAIRINKNSEETTVTVELYNISGKQASFFERKLIKWIMTKLKLPIESISVKNIDPPGLEVGADLSKLPQLSFLIQAIKVVLHRVDSQKPKPDDKTCLSCYVQQYRMRVPLFFNKTVSKKHLHEVFSAFALDEQEIQTLLQSTKQDFIIEQLLAMGADLGLNSAFSNVFRVALHHYNENFVKKLLSYNINPFFQDQVIGLLNQISYDFSETATLLYHYTQHKHGQKQSVLHTAVQLFDGGMEVNCRGNIPRINLIVGLLTKEPNLLNSKSEEGNTALFTAIASANLTAILVLVERGASLLIKNRQGAFPIDLLKSLEHQFKPKDFKKAFNLLLITMSSTYNKISEAYYKTKEITQQDLLHLSNEYEFITFKKIGNTEQLFVKRLTEDMLGSDTETEDSSDENAEETALEESELEFDDFDMQTTQPDSPGISTILKKLSEIANQPNIENFNEFISKSLSLILLAFQNMDWLGVSEQEKANRELDKIINLIMFHLKDSDKIEVLKQLLISGGGLKSERMQNLLTVLGDRLRAKPNKELQMLGFFCDVKSENFHLMDFYKRDLLENASEQDSQIFKARAKKLMNSRPIFQAFAYQFGQSCLLPDNQTDTVMTQEEIRQALTLPPASPVESKQQAEAEVLSSPLLLSAAGSELSLQPMHTSSPEKRGEKRKCPEPSQSPVDATETPPKPSKMIKKS